jgi:hypothetical protein
MSEISRQSVSLEIVMPQFASQNSLDDLHLMLQYFFDASNGEPNDMVK